MASQLGASAQIKYPATYRENVVDNYNGVTVEDPYRWLEDDNSERTKQWVIEQNKITFDYLNQIPFRKQVRDRLEKLWNYPKYSSPFKKGDWYYFFKNDGLQNQSVMYRQKGLQGTPEEFLNPNTLNKEGVAALSGLGFSKKGKYMAYSISVAGSDWQEVYVMETATKKVLPDTIRWVKFSGFNWLGEDGFYYSRYDQPDEKTRLSRRNEFQKVYYHKIGTSQAEDKLIYEDKKHPLRFHGVGATEDERFLILYVSEGTSGSELWYMDRKDASQKQFKLLIPGFASEASVVDNDGDRLLVRTNIDAPNYRVVSIDPKKPAKQNWKEIIPEKSEALQGVGSCGRQLFADYLKDASTRVYQYNYDGSLVREVYLPGIGTASGFGGEPEDKELFFTFTSFTTPPAIYRYDITTGGADLFRSTSIAMNTSEMVTEQLFFNSKDGTRVPMFLTYKKGIERNGNNPVLLYGYGGFNIPMTPGFSISNAFFIEQGGIYVVVNLRGGSEYGEAWHKGGMLEKKQNVFDDFIGAAEYLIKNRFTNPNRIAIRGGSNGGLLVGAVMTQRPDLFRVALPQVGVLDMLRFHKFTVGAAWAVEYGNADTASQFPFLYKYSPYHNLKTGVKYPATLVTTADHDDRVVPAHSFKFAARLQAYAGQTNGAPLLIRIDTDAGHGAGKPTSKSIDEAADIWSFVMNELGMSFIEDGAGVPRGGTATEGKGSGGDGSFSLPSKSGSATDTKGASNAGARNQSQPASQQESGSKPAAGNTNSSPATKAAQQQQGSSSPLRKRKN